MNAADPSASRPLKLPISPLNEISLERVATLEGHKERVWCVAWCPTSMVLASSSADRTVRLWSLSRSSAATGSSSFAEWGCIGTLEGEHDRTVRHISWSPSGEYLACASFDHTATVWRRTLEGGGFNMEVEGVLDGHESEVKCVEWATDGTLATCSRDHTVWIWERVDEGEYECAGILSCHTQDVKYCLWNLSPYQGDRPLILSCGYDDTIRVWCDSHRNDDWYCFQTLKQHEGTVWMAAFQRLEYGVTRGEAGTRGDADGSAEAGGEEELGPQPLLCSCSDDRRVIFWKRGAGGSFVSVAQASGFTTRSIYAVDWAPHGDALVACGSGDNSVTLLSLSQDADGVHVQVAARVAAAHEADVNSVSFSPFGKLAPGEGPSRPAAPENGRLLLATAGDDKVIHLWRVAAGDMPTAAQATGPG